MTQNGPFVLGGGYLSLPPSFAPRTPKIPTPGRSPAAPQEPTWDADVEQQQQQQQLEPRQQQWQRAAHVPRRLWRLLGSARDGDSFVAPGGSSPSFASQPQMSGCFPGPPTSPSPPAPKSSQLPLQGAASGQYPGLPWAG